MAKQKPDAPKPASDPVVDVAEAIRKAEAAAPPLAEVPFSLTAPIWRRSSDQGGLF